MTRFQRVLATLLSLLTIILGSAWPRTGQSVATPDRHSGAAEVDEASMQGIQAVLAAMLEQGKYTLTGEPDALLATRAVYRLCRLRGESSITQEALQQRVDTLFDDCTLTALDPAAAMDCIQVLGTRIELSGEPEQPELTELVTAGDAVYTYVYCHAQLGELEADAQVVLVYGRISCVFLT